MTTSMENTIKQLEDIMKQVDDIKNNLTQLNEQNELKEKELKELRLQNWELKQELEAQKKKTVI